MLLRFVLGVTEVMKCFMGFVIQTGVDHADKVSDAPVTIALEPELPRISPV